jgi:hypothetical protein
MLSSIPKHCLITVKNSDESSFYPSYSGKLCKNMGLAGLMGVPRDSHGRTKRLSPVGLMGLRSWSRGSGTKFILVPWEISMSNPSRYAWRNASAYSRRELGIKLRETPRWAPIALCETLRLPTCPKRRSSVDSRVVWEREARGRGEWYPRGGYL